MRGPSSPKFKFLRSAAALAVSLFVYSSAAHAQVTHFVSSTVPDAVKTGVAEVFGEVRLTKDIAPQATSASTITFMYDVSITNLFLGSQAMNVVTNSIVAPGGITITGSGGWINAGVSATVSNVGGLGQITVTVPNGLNLSVGNYLAINGVRGNLTSKPLNATASVSLDATPGAHSFTNGTTSNVATAKQGLTVSASGVTNPVCNAPSNPVITVAEGFAGAFVQHVAVGGITPQSPRSGYGADANLQVQIVLTGLQSGVSLNWPDYVTGSSATGTLVIVSESSTTAVYQYSTTNQATSDLAIESFAVIPIVTMTATAASGQATVQAQLLPVAAGASLPRFDDPLQPAIGPNFITIVGCNPAPVLTAINPTSITAGQSPFTLTVTGSNFVSGSVVRWNLQARSTSYVDSTQLRADILAGDIAATVPVSVTVESPGPGGGISVALPFTINTVSPVPTLAALNPSSATVGGADFILTVTGTNFNSGSVVRWNNAARPTTVVDPSTLRADIPAADIASAGTATITVFNPTPGGGTSNPATFTINYQAPVPTVTAISPSSGTAGSGNFQLVVTGTNFTTDSKVRWNGLDRNTTFVSSTEVRAAINASDVAAVGSASVTVYNAPPGGGTSANAVFTINNPLPTITGLTPNSALVGNSAVVVTVNGAYFVNGSVVTWNNSNLTTTYSSATQLRATIPAANLTAAGVFNIAVVNVPTGGGVSNAEPFFVGNQVPTLSTINPTTRVQNGGAFTLTLNGTKFFSGSVVRWGGQSRPTTFVASTQLTADIPATDLAAVGPVSITVYNPETGGGASNAQTLNVNNPVPAISSLSPAGATTGEPGLTLTVSGSNFVTGSKVRWNGTDRATSYVSTTQLRATILPADLATAATVNVTVLNPTPGGGLSPTQAFVVSNSGPVISSLAPSSIGAGSAGFSLSVKGSGFVSTSKVRWNGAEIATKFASATELTATVVATAISQPGTASVTVYTAGPGGGTSSPQTFTIGSPVAITTGLSPNTALAGGAGFTLTVNGSRFISTSKVLWNSVEKVTRFISNSQLTATIPSSDLSLAGPVLVTVLNPNNGDELSNAQTFTINNPLPTIASLSPSLARVSETPFTLTVNGSNYVSSSKVRWKGFDRPTTFVSSTRLTAEIPASDLVATGSVNVTVFNPTPGGGNSNAVSYTIGNALPLISGLNPSSVLAGAGAFTLTVNGNYFLNSSKVRWNGSDRTTVFVNVRQLLASVTAADVASVGIANITVINTTADGPSSATPFPINPLMVTSLSISPSSVVGGGSVTATLLLNGPASPGGTLVSLFSSNRTVASVPINIRVPAGASSASFPISTQGVSSTTSVVISAVYGGITRRATLAVGDMLTSTSDPTSIVFVPIILNSSGINGSFFTSALTLTNRGLRDALVDFTYTSAFGEGSGKVSDVLLAGQQRIFANAISYLKSLGLPIPDDGNRGGTLKIRFWGLGSSSDVAATVRTTTAVTGGRAGLSYPAVSLTSTLNAPAYLFGLRQNATDRSNVAIQNVGSEEDGDVTVSLTVYSGENAVVPVTLPDITVPPGGFRQINSVLDVAGLSVGNGYVRVERVGGTAPYYAYGVINDQANSDGSFVAPVPETELRGRDGLTLPVLVEAGTFASELVLTNSSGVTRTVRASFVADGIQTPDASAVFTLQLAPGQQAIFPNFIQTLRDSGVSGIAPAGNPLAGALFVTVDGRDVSGLFVGARTSAPGGGGRYGLFYCGVSYGRAASSVAWLNGLQQNLETRSNLALVNTGEIDDSRDVFRIELFDGDTATRVATIDGISLSPRQWIQFQMILDQYAPGTRQGYARVSRIAGTNPFIAYAVLNDGGEPGARTGDGAYVAMDAEE